MNRTCSDAFLGEPVPKLLLVVEECVDRRIGEHVGDHLERALGTAANSQEFMYQCNTHGSSLPVLSERSESHM